MRNTRSIGACAALTAALLISASHVAIAQQDGAARGAGGRGGLAGRGNVPGMKEDSFKTKDGAKITYYEAGTGPDVVLIHGAGTTAHGNWIYNGTFAELAKNHHVVALDCRGDGKSERPASAAAAATTTEGQAAPAGGRGAGRRGGGAMGGMGSMVTDVIELMDHLKIAKAHIVGYSRGGMITNQLITRIPERFITVTFSGSAYTGGRGARGDATPPATDNAAAKVNLADIPALTINGEQDGGASRGAAAERVFKIHKTVVIPGATHVGAVSSPLLRAGIAEFINEQDARLASVNAAPAKEAQQPAAPAAQQPTATPAAQPPAGQPPAAPAQGAGAARGRGRGVAIGPGSQKPTADIPAVSSAPVSKPATAPPPVTDKARELMPKAPPLKEGFFVTNDGYKIHYLEQGTGPDVVLIHGLSSSASANWCHNGNMAALAVNHHVVAIDCLNHGESDKPSPGSAGRAQDAIALMDHLKIKKAHIAGYSMGGAETGQLLRTNPDRFVTAIFAGSDAPAGLDLAALNIPMMVINGDQDRAATKGVRVKEQVKDHKLVTVPESTHNNAPRHVVFVANMVEWINSHDAKP